MFLPGFRGLEVAALAHERQEALLVVRVEALHEEHPGALEDEGERVARGDEVGRGGRAVGEGGDGRVDVLEVVAVDVGGVAEPNGEHAVAGDGERHRGHLGSQDDERVDVFVDGHQALSGVRDDVDLAHGAPDGRDALGEPPLVARLGSQDDDGVGGPAEVGGEVAEVDLGEDGKAHVLGDEAGVLERVVQAVEGVPLSGPEDVDGGVVGVDVELVGFHGLFDAQHGVQGDPRQLHELLLLVAAEDENGLQDLQVEVLVRRAAGVADHGVVEAAVAGVPVDVAGCLQELVAHFVELGRGFHVLDGVQRAVVQVLVDGDLGRGGLLLPGLLRQLDEEGPELEHLALRGGEVVVWLRRARLFGQLVVEALDVHAHGLGEALVGLQVVLQLGDALAAGLQALVLGSARLRGAGDAGGGGLGAALGLEQVDASQFAAQPLDLLRQHAVLGLQFLVVQRQLAGSLAQLREFLVLLRQVVREEVDLLLQRVRLPQVQLVPLREHLELRDNFLHLVAQREVIVDLALQLLLVHVVGLG
ncbi:MATE family efflux transporter [Babesia caballi]|uniref:MATE family efflux transporter n=1 Tax=Babesia caballi TaxID=5871 RepID=A0AAV4LPJ1_BABCB|nr:MATE family efflux transporter [Babesia caballi]